MAEADWRTLATSDDAHGFVPREQDPTRPPRTAGGARPSCRDSPRPKTTWCWSGVSKAYLSLLAFRTAATVRPGPCSARHGDGQC
jgi:hypothetical protein